MAMIWGGTNLQTTYDFFVENFEPGIPNLIVTKRDVPGLHGSTLLATRLDTAEHTVVGFFKSTVTFSNFKSFENALLGTIATFANYESTTVTPTTMQMSHIDPSTTFTNCVITSIKILDYKRTGSLAIPEKLEIKVTQLRPGIS